jgi:2-methylisocitrate lyase-like PEP mutase family enzyme
MTKFEQFRTLHWAKELFILPNAWDAKSAILLEEAGFSAVGTSSAAVAAGLGYCDGENMSFNEYLFVIKRILASVKIPVTVDLEMGYGKTNEDILKNLVVLTELGVAGINIEDSLIEGSKRSLKNADQFAKTIGYLKEGLASHNATLFINIRCDTYILGVNNKQEETAKRLHLYETTGADGIFLPCISNENDIAEAVNSTRLPVSVMCIPGLPDFDTLNKLGVKRASMGPFLFNKIYNNISTLSQTIIQSKRFQPIL